MVHTDTTDIIRALGRLEGKCDSIIMSLKDHTGRMNRIDEDVEDVRTEVSKVKESIVSIKEHLATKQKVEALEADIRLIEKKQYAIIVVASLLCTVAVELFRKFF